MTIMLHGDAHRPVTLGSPRASDWPSSFELTQSEYDSRYRGKRISGGSKDVFHRAPHLLHAFLFPNSIMLDSARCCSRRATRYVATPGNRSAEFIDAKP